jgi:Mechanosensitive ion channel, conserved TM helix
MNGNFWDSAFLEPLRHFVDQALSFLLHNLLAMLVVLLVGVLAAYAVRLLLTLVLRVLGFDRFGERHGVTATLQTAGIALSPTVVVARVAFWLVMVVFLILSLAALNIAPMTDLVSRLFIFLPQLLAALVILVLGYVVSVFLQRAALLAAVNAGLPRARALAGAVQMLVLLFTAAMALEQVGIGRNIVLAAFSVAFGSVGLAAALAFGYAARDLARSVLERHLAGADREGLGEISHL